MICKKCGCRVGDTASYCTKCGAPLAEFGIQEEATKNNESTIVKNGKALVQKIKSEKKIQIILVGVIVLLIFGALAGWYINKDKVFGIAPYMSSAQVERILGKDVTVYKEADIFIAYTKEDVKMGKYNGSLSVSFMEDEMLGITWHLKDDKIIPKQDLMKMVERKYGENQVTEDTLPPTVYIGKSSIWNVQVISTDVSYDDYSDDIEGYGEVDIYWSAK